MCNPWDSSVYLPWHLFNLWNQHVINYSEGSSILCFVSISNRSHVVTGTLFIIHSLWLLTLLIGIAFPGGLMDSINHPFNVKIRNQRLNVSISFWMTSFIFWCNVQESEAVRPWAPFLLSCSTLLLEEKIRNERRVMGYIFWIFHPLSVPHLLHYYWNVNVICPEITGISFSCLFHFSLIDWSAKWILRIITSRIHPCGCLGTAHGRGNRL